MKSVVAIVITYHPDLDKLSSSLQIIKNQVSRIVIVDNSSNNLLAKRSAILDDPQIHLIQIDDNLGIAKAQNVGIAWARTLKADFVLLLDQDSQPACDMVSKLLAGYGALTAQSQKVSAVGPVFRDKNTSNSANFIRFGRFKYLKISQPDSSGYILADFLIASGSLIPTGVLDDVGGMDESLFIDNVDTEWFLRARVKGYKAFGVPGAIMEHSLGDNTVKIWFGRWRHVPQHKPFRNYYMFRNTVVLCRRDYIPFQWKINDLVRLVYLFFFGLVCMPERFIRFKMIVLGIYDGLRGVSGKLSHSCD